MSYIRGMNNQELIDYVVKEFDGTLIDEYGWEHYKVKDKDYLKQAEKKP